MSRIRRRFVLFKKRINSRHSSVTQAITDNIKSSKSQNGGGRTIEDKISASSEWPASSSYDVGKPVRPRLADQTGCEFQFDTMPLTVDLSLNVKLVEIIKNFPCLYNSFLPDYFKRDITDDAWEKVSEKMNEPVADCKQKWRNLRTVYVRKLKTEAESGGKRIRSYYLTNAMEFLKPFVRAHKPVNLNSSSEFEYVEAELSNSRDTDNNELEDETELEEIQNAEAYHRNDITVKIEETKTTRMHPNRSSDNNESADSSMAEKIVLPSTSRKRKLDSDNPRIQFLLSMEPDIQIMTDAQMRKFKRKVLEIINEILDE